MLRQALGVGVRVGVRVGVLVGVLAGLLAACGAGRERGPAWPKPLASETDGGESLAPRPASPVAAIEAAEDEAPDLSGPAAAGAAGAPAASAPAAKADKSAPEVPSSRELDILMTDDIVIEIDD